MKFTSEERANHKFHLSTPKFRLNTKTLNAVIVYDPNTKIRVSGILSCITPTTFRIGRVIYSRNLKIKNFYTGQNLEINNNKLTISS